MNPAEVAVAGVLACSTLAALAALVRPASIATARLQGVLLILSAGFLGGAAVAAIGGHPVSLAVVLPPPFAPFRFDVAGLAPAWLGLAALLFAATGAVRAGGYRPGGTGTLALQHALLVAVAAFLTSESPLALLLAWESLSLISYLLVVRDRPRVQRAAWALLALAELGAVVLLLALLVWRAAGPAGAPATLGPAWSLGLALLALAAFGTKAGLFPFLVWVPFAEPEADGDTAGLLSGLLTAVALAGFLHLVRVLAPAQTALGLVTGAFGLAGAIYGALMGLVERDAKRVLAYGTVEALGLSFTGFGLGWVLAGQGAGNAAVLAVAGAWILLLAHAGAKYALFVLAGHVEQAGGLRRLDAMGGLLRPVRRGGVPALVAVLALAGLPPFGGFLGEWLILEACFVPAPAATSLHIVLALLAAVLALVGAAGLTLYLRWFGIGWLGMARSARAARCPDTPAGTTAGAWLGAGLACGTGIAAGWLLPWLARQTAWMASGAPIVAPTYIDPRPYATIVALGAALFRGVGGSTGNVLFPAGGFAVGSPWDLSVFVLLAAGSIALIRARGRRSRVRTARPWIGGEPASSPRYAFSGEGLSHPLRLAFAGFFGLSRTRSPLPPAEGTSGVPGALAVPPPPGHIRYRADVVLRLEHHVFRPLLRAAAGFSGAARRTQSGRVAHYVAFLLVVVVAGLVVLAL